MASASRNERKKRRIRRNLTLTRKAYRNEAINRVKVQTVLLAILAARGGEIEVTKADLDSAVKSLGQAYYVVEPSNPDNPDNGLFTVKLVTTTEPVEQPVEPTAVELAQGLREDRAGLSDPVHVQIATVLGDCETDD